jgi:hypothetical protein
MTTWIIVVIMTLVPGEPFVAWGFDRVHTNDRAKCEQLAADVAYGLKYERGHKDVWAYCVRQSEAPLPTCYKNPKLCGRIDG